MSAMSDHEDTERDTPAGPYATAAHTYWRSGWRGILPLPARAKTPVPKGWTGRTGEWPSYPDIAAWTDDHAAGNIALRLPPDVLGVDVDSYDAKPGGMVLAQLEGDLGALPATWRTTSRDDGTSGIRLYRIPPGLRWPGVLGPGIETIRHEHRYAVAWPSIHPEGRTYRWIRPDGSVSLHEVPTAEELPELPEAWVVHFTGGELATDQPKANLSSGGASTWLTTHGAGEPCAAMQRALRRCDLTPAAGARHDAMVSATNRLIWLAGEGHTGAGVALADVKAGFLAATTQTRQPGEAENEWDRAVTGAVDLAAAAHPGVGPDPCRQPFHGIINQEDACAPTATAPTSSGTPPKTSPSSSAQAAATSSMSAPTQQPEPAVVATDTTDDGRQWHRGQPRFAYLLAQHYGDELMHVHGIGWHVWDGRRWAEDTGQAKRAVLALLHAGWQAALHDKDMEKDVKACNSASGINGVLDIAAALETFAVTVADLDADPYLLNCANGTLDLRTGELRAHDPADRITKVTRGAHDPAATGARWQAFLETVLPDVDVRSFLQRLAGLALLGRVTEHVFPIATGTGANGKGTTYNALLWAMGDYGHVAEPDLFMAARTNANAASPAKVSLRGVRLVVVSETERHHKLAEALMKNLTGGDPVTARPLYGKPITFDPSHTPLMVTNFLPKVSGDDPATWRRIRVVPFNVTVPESERDPHLGEHLQLDADAVLAWAVAGYAEYERIGLAAPEAVKVATEHYQHDSDAVARFVEDCCITGPHYHATVAELWERWTRWKAVEGGEDMSKKAFNQALERHGFSADVMPGGRRIRRGIGLQAEDDQEEASWL